ncbi:MAG TPA: site-specific integrase, partial [Acidimicrobiales bacterium]|nr:site-specific integrase [Acidimicrobiales bacterium]
AAINAAHRLAGVPSPTGHEGVGLVVRGIRRTKGVAPAQVRPVILEDLRQMVATLPESLAGTRDRALLLVGWAGAFRRSELVALNVEDLEPSDEGLVVTVRRSKTDQEAAGRQVGLPYSATPLCPVAAIGRWLDVTGITSGPVFRKVDRNGHIGAVRLNPASVAEVVKRAAAAAGLDPRQFSGHSLRAGLATSAAANGATESLIMAQTGHKSTAMVRRYIRRANLFRQNAASIAGL